MAEFRRTCGDRLLRQGTRAEAAADLLGYRPTHCLARFDNSGPVVLTLRLKDLPPEKTFTSDLDKIVLVVRDPDQGSHRGYVACHYLNEAAFGPADLHVTKLRSTERAESLLVRMSQDGKDILAALVAASPTNQFGPKVNWQEAPDVTPPEDLAQTHLDEDVVEIMGDEPLWKILEFRMVKGLGREPRPTTADGFTEEEIRLTPSGDAHLRGWQRMSCGEGNPDPWVDACRHLIIAAALQFPTVADPFTPPLTFIAPTMSLTVEFHSFHPDEQWLLADAIGSHAGDGLLGAETRLWTRAGDLIATAHSQMTSHDLSDPRIMARLQKSWFQMTDA